MPDDDRDLQSTYKKSGKFIILSHERGGKVLYSFDSRDKFQIQNQNFAPVGIAHRPQFGNYNEGEDNTNDVLMWGSGRLGGSSGSSMLFQLPQNFNSSLLEQDDQEVDVSDFEVRVLESVSWTTATRPTFSASGLDVYFAISGNKLTGWNSGKKFNFVANLGPMPLLFGDPNKDLMRPIVLVEEAGEDPLLLLGSSDYDTFFVIDAKTGGTVYTIGGLGTGATFTTPQVSDGRAYIGKGTSVLAINLADGSLPWGEDGYKHPSNTASDKPMGADFSLSSTGEVLYYARNGGQSISAIEVAREVPTEAPVATPTSSPSLASSTTPSESALPTTSPAPTVSMLPTPSPTLTKLPSSQPSSSSVPTVFVDRSESPSSSPTDAPSSSPTVTKSAPQTAAPVVADSGTGTAPTAPPADPQAAQPSSSPVAVASPSSVPGPAPAEAGSQDSQESSSPLSMPAIIGIAVGGGVGLVLMLGAICYVCKKKNGDDGVDRAWQASHAQDENASRGDRATFQYGDEEDNQNQHRHGEPLRW